jgi:hypothetical protein
MPRLTHGPPDAGTDAGTDAGADAGWLEILLHVTPDRQIALAAYGSGPLREISRTFRSGAELGHFIAGLLADPDVASHPVLAALRAAAQVVRREPDADTTRSGGSDNGPPSPSP